MRAFDKDIQKSSLPKLIQIKFALTDIILCVLTFN